MRIYELKSKDGTLRGFEVENVLLGRSRACRIAASIAGATVVRKHRPFRDEDDFCEFIVDGHTFIIEEPYGDNSRYWIGSKDEHTTAALSKVRAAFEHHKTSEAPLRVLLATSLLLGAWYLYPRVMAHIEQDRCLDAGGRWDTAQQACKQSGQK